MKGIADRVKALKVADLTNSNPVPTELVTASASGLDPQISVAAAEYQASRIAKARGIQESAVKSLINGISEKRTLGILGEPTVNVLMFNLALDNNLKLE